MKVLIKTAWGSDDPTKAAFAFLHANAFAEAGHESFVRAQPEKWRTVVAAFLREHAD